MYMAAVSARSGSGGTGSWPACSAVMRSQRAGEGIESTTGVAPLPAAIAVTASCATTRARSSPSRVRSAYPGRLRAAMAACSAPSAATRSAYRSPRSTSSASERNIPWAFSTSAISSPGDPHGRARRTAASPGSRPASRTRWLRSVRRRGVQASQQIGHALSAPHLVAGLLELGHPGLQREDLQQVRVRQQDRRELLHRAGNAHRASDPPGGRPDGADIITPGAEYGTAAAAPESPSRRRIRHT